ncbi:hypothetical protein AMJ85_03580 [candidate division BRC1 bacterium SM23_51]|nr:MAG: hypothetical protein AMJ85_03580 [candidate division BRC1 bacterium SM23_51]
MDLFTVWIDRQPVLAADQAIAGDTISTQTVTGEARAVAGLSSLSECGRININSAPVAVLRVLPGLSNRQIEHLLVRRDVALRTDPAGGPIVYGQWSELLADDGFWADASPSARLRQVGEWIASVTFTSNAYRIVSENRTQPPSGPRLASRSRVEALVATDGMQNQVVAWRYLK